jgi:abortive infection bacteriophage resistance protein
MSKQVYNKLPKSFSEQVELLEKRGLIIPNKEKAENILTYISYNRLSNYWFPMLKKPKEEELFKGNSNFETIFKIYQFDSELRTITFQAIEQIEIAIRTQIIYHFSHKYQSGFLV